MADEDSPATRRRARAHSNEIDAQIKKDAAAKRDDKSSKILLLGSGDSGKTTVLKQMKILHGAGFSAAERAGYKRIIAQNILESMKALVEALEPLDLELSNPELKPIAKKVLKYEFPQSESAPPLSDEIVQAIKALWQDVGIQEALRNANQFFIQDTAEHFLMDVDKFVAPKYVPDDQDVLYARQRTTEISQHVFTIDKRTIKVFDVGGQLSERVFWAPYFEAELDAILFIASLAAYDQRLVEDAAVSRMLDALLLFESVANHPLLRNVGMILFLNKTDLFMQKLQWSPINRFFPDYKGGNDLKSAGTFFAHKFQAQNKVPDRRIYTHFTTGTDSKHMNVILRAVKDTVVRANLAASGL
ncbi:guanine nucleotide-binding protein subunit alpha [Geranomyces variabilis]|nr:guanine nucleotide-binding protein subunit alpha [Geranomyces variabilis]